MYDPETSKLIQLAPRLRGLNVDDLPKLLTEAFSTIVSTRIRLRDHASDEELSKILTMLNRIAAAYEVYTAVLPEESKGRASAAFVSATAYQLISQSRKEANSDSFIETSEVSSDISAALLFLLAGAHADATEFAKKIKPSSDAREIEELLISAIRDLVLGKVKDVTEIQEPSIDVTEDNSDNIALDGLLLLLLRGVISLAYNILIGVSRRPPRSIFLQVQKLCIDRVDDIPLEGVKPINLFSGPLHLANLLIGIDKDLKKLSVFRIPSPKGIDSTKWYEFLRIISNHRPYLWKNHRDVIRGDYLEKGTSSAISFPTGAGKSTLSYFKIASTIFRNERVIFLAPTRALVAQVRRELDEIFNDYSVLSSVDEDPNLVTDKGLGEITVMTPECCLLLISIIPEEFSNVGLIVFDECHILHQDKGTRNRRSLDSMLAIINLTLRSPDADLLFISAMMQNTKEIAKWVAHITGKKCDHFDLVWKPTRQARGCVVYSSDDIRALNENLAHKRQNAKGKKSISDKIRNDLYAQPYAFFCLLQNWTKEKRGNYKVFKVLKDPYTLSATSRKNYWKLTPNRNVVSRKIAESSANAGLKTLVFCQDIRDCNNNTKLTSLPDSSRSTTRLNEHERELFNYTVKEMGGAEYCYLDIDADGSIKSDAISHHALLSSKERELHESIFRRSNGVKIMFTTSTLSQGMNLPCDVVILSSNKRYDRSTDESKSQDIHDLLNAAGRAGRAGKGSHGVVLLIPSEVIDVENDEFCSVDQWNKMNELFGESDQCVSIVDPLESLLDDIQNDCVNSEDLEYLLSRLHLNSSESETDMATRIIQNSLCAYNAHRRNDQDWIDSRVESAINRCSKMSLSESEKWIGQVSSATGLTIDILRQIMKLFDENRLSGGPDYVVYSLLDWLEMHPRSLTKVMRPSNLEKMCGSAYSSEESEEVKAKIVTDELRRLLKLWITGRPLCEIERQTMHKKNDEKCKNARHFALNVVPDFSFVASIPGYLMSARLRSQDRKEGVSVVLKMLGQMVREGCDSPESLVVRRYLNRSKSRVEDYEYYNKIRSYIEREVSGETFQDTIERVKKAMRLYRMSKFEE